VFGYQDAKTGTFHALSKAAVDATTSPTTGTFDVTFNLKLVSTFAKGTTAYCEAFVTVTSFNETTDKEVSYEEEATGSVALSGSTATCTATIPYSWLLPAASSTVQETLGGSYTVFAGTPVADNGITIAGVGRLSSSQFLAATSVPASGTTSKYSVNVTL
jgi:hypothetical protein